MDPKHEDLPSPFSKLSPLKDSSNCTDISIALQSPLSDYQQKLNLDDAHCKLPISLNNNPFAITLRPPCINESTGSNTEKFTIEHLMVDNPDSLINEINTEMITSSYEIPKFVSINISQKENYEENSPNIKCSIKKSSKSTNMSRCQKQNSRSLDGKSCHQCKVRRDDNELRFCSYEWPRKTGNGLRKCRKKFCTFCLSRHYPDSLSDETNWICPCCRGICKCLGCCRIVQGNIDEPLGSF